MLSLSFKLKFFNFFLPSSIFFAVLNFISFAFFEVSIFNLFDVHFAYSLLNLSYLVQSSEYEIVKLNKEMNYENTFEKDDKIQKEYKQYLESIERRKNGTREIN